MSSNKNITKQEQMIDFLAGTMTVVEQKNFSIRAVNLCSSIPYILPNEIVTEYMFIIGDDAYFEEVDRCLDPKKNHTALEYSQLITEEKEALLLRYGYQSVLTPEQAYKFKKLANPSSKGNKKFDSNIGRFPYLAETLIFLDESIKKEQFQAEEQIEAAGKVIVKTLNTL